MKCLEESQYLAGLSKMMFSDIVPQQSSQAFLWSILNTITDPIFVKDRQHKWVLVNDAFCQFIGYQRKELIGKSDYDFFCKTEADVFWERYELVFTTGVTDEHEELITNSQGETQIISTKKSLLYDEAGNSFIVGLVRLIGSKNKIETALLRETVNKLEQEIYERQQTEKRLCRHSNALQQLVQSEKLQHDDFKIAIEYITEVASLGLDVERVSVWLYTEKRLGIQCIDLYQRENNYHSHGLELFVCDFPNYFQALKEEQVIAVSNVHSDRRTSEFSETYTTPLGITSMLDARIWSRGEVIGVVCCEHLGVQRQWTLEEESFISSISDFVRLVIESRDRKIAEEALRQSEMQLRQQTQQLEEALKELQHTQVQMLQNEKMSSLGQLVAGVAHEINNPVNFIYGNIAPAHDYIHNLLNLIQLYQEYYPDPIPVIQSKIVAIDLEFLMEDLPKLLSSIKIGAERIQQIVVSLRNFSRLDEAEYKAVDIHEGIDSTLLILDNRLKARPDRPAIQIIKEYDNLPLIECYAGQLNQVFMNILTNAIDALEERHQQQSQQKTKPSLGVILIRTKIINKNQITIKIADNGLGIPEKIKQRIFDPFFTTKPIGKGTGMGMSISYQIVTKNHHGTIECISSPHQGTAFVIVIPLKQQHFVQ
ncbi:PAS domain S-box protein [Nostoc punctiforme FACHB-252]|uniref:histidine kinase n=1 Tax=Nostoc punctiforme FACHB-252 TaxID=1357509 RepID=A0ABR8H9P4_NOSPU|nr:ATP-binding protein [Nostoc punctiforme]MBD2612341.1 PAS domain S-box protein [Nostoc punctiforme FACHB-252]MDZ8013146.1 ATP-binding protein [Nostoc sp. ZfuVER08]